MRERTPQQVASVDKPAVADAAVVPVVVAPDAAAVPTTPEIEAKIDAPPVQPDRPNNDATRTDKPPPDTPIAAKPPGESKPKPPVAKPPVDEETDDGDEAVKQKLVEAQAALDANKFDRAEQLANMVSTSEDANPRQRARATLIYGMLQCMVRNDESTARASLRKLAGTPKLRKKLLDTCHAAKYLQDVRR
jgi:hypothetical protein